MSVLLETTAGDMVVDLHVDLCPALARNFLWLCHVKFYSFSPFHRIQSGFTAQTGDPHFDGGRCAQDVLEHGHQGSPKDTTKRFIKVQDEFLNNPRLKHKETGTVAMACTLAQDGTYWCGSQFYITLAPNIEYLDGKHAIIGLVAEGLDVLEKLNTSVQVDESYRPFTDIRIKHAIILDNPFPLPPKFQEPPRTPSPTRKQLANVRIAEGESLDDGMDAEEKEKLRRQRDAAAQALTLEILGDIPFAEAKPPENVLFVCKLNPVTRDEDLELIFSRFGKIASCEIIRDKKTGDSLQYAFIEFDEKEAAEEAYFKMDNVLIDERRIHVDFSQSVAKLHKHWNIGRAMNQEKQGTSLDGLVLKEQYRQTGSKDAEDKMKHSRGYDMIFEGTSGSRLKITGTSQSAELRTNMERQERQWPTSQRGNDRVDSIYGQDRRFRERSRSPRRRSPNRYRHDSRR